MKNRYEQIHKLLGPSYQLIDLKYGGIGGYYNFYIIFLLIIVLMSLYSLFNVHLLWYLLASFIFATCLQVNRYSFSISALPSQLLAYFNLLFKWLMDIWMDIVLSFVIFILIRKHLPNLSLFHNGLNSFYVLYGVYFFVRFFFLLKYLASILIKNEKSIFSNKHANLKNSKESIKHVLWSFFLGNFGLTVRCGTQVIIIFIFNHVWSITNLGEIDIGLIPSIVIELFLCFIVVYYGTPKSLALYYKIHRTLHENKSLYSSLHRVHHFAVYPTVLDSANISPFEFLLTEGSPGIFLAILPDWLFVLVSIRMLAFHFACHHEGFGEDLLDYHVNHHHFININYGLNPAGDILFNTYKEYKKTLFTDLDPTPAAQYWRSLK
jgi:hypothetical protein